MSEPSVQGSASQRHKERQENFDAALRERGLTIEGLTQLKAIQQEVQELEVEAQREIWEQALGDIPSALRAHAELGYDCTAFLRSIIEQVLDGTRTLFPSGTADLSNEHIIQMLDLKEPA